MSTASELTVSSTPNAKVVVFGGSVALGWPDQICYGQVLATRAGLPFAAYGGPHKTIRDTRMNVELLAAADWVIIQHGVSESIRRPNEEASASLPSRFRAKGGLDPAPWKSRNRARRFLQWLRNRVKWLLRIKCILVGQTFQLVSLDQFVAEFDEFLSAVITKVPASRVVVVGPIRLPNRYYPFANVHLRGYVEAMERLAIAHHVSYVDIRDVLTSGDLLADRLHPTSAGHTKIADRITPFIEVLAESHG